MKPTRAAPLWMLVAFALMATLTGCSDDSFSGPICAVSEKGLRVVIDVGETGDFQCITNDQAPPPGFKEFPGGAPKYNSDPRWREYSSKYFSTSRAKRKASSH